MLKLYLLICVAIIAVSSEDINSEDSDTQNAFEVLAKKFDTWTENLKIDTDDLKAGIFIKELRDRLNKAVEEVKSKIPNDIVDMHEFADKAKKGTDEIIGHFKTLTESDEAKRIKEFSMTKYNDAKNTFNDLKKMFE